MIHQISFLYVYSLIPHPIIMPTTPTLRIPPLPVLLHILQRPLRKHFRKHWWGNFFHYPIVSIIGLYFVVVFYDVSIVFWCGFDFDFDDADSDVFFVMGLLDVVDVAVLRVD